MTPAQWNAYIALDAPPIRFRRAVEHAARVHLSTLATDERISTEELVEALYPRDVAKGTLAGDTARTNIYAALARLAQGGLEDCAVKGEVNGMFMGKPKRPWLWFSPGDVEVCYACGQIIPVGKE
jgi:hypothetical protein